MSDKFDDISNDEILDEVANRSLENDVDCDCS